MGKFTFWCVCVCSVSGLGFRLMSGAFLVVNILSDAVGPGTVGIHGDSQHYFISSGDYRVCERGRERILYMLFFTSLLFCDCHLLFFLSSLQPL